MKILNCKRCKHEWCSKKPKNVKVCPKCKSPYWDTERKLKNKRKNNE